MTEADLPRPPQGTPHIPVVIASGIGMDIPLLVAFTPHATRELPLFRQRGWTAFCDELVRDTGASTSIRVGGCDLDLEGRSTLRGELRGPTPIRWRKAVEFAGRKVVYVVAPPFIATDIIGAVSRAALASLAGSRLTVQALITLHGG